MTTLTEMIHDYHKKNGIEYKSLEYVHTFQDRSTITFLIDTADKDIVLKGWSANVMTKQFTVTTRTDTFPRLDWFDGKTFRTIQSAIKAIQKDLKGQ